MQIARPQGACSRAVCPTADKGGHLPTGVEIQGKKSSSIGNVSPAQATEPGGPSSCPASSVGRGRRVHARRDGGGVRRRRPQLLDGVELVAAALAAAAVAAVPPVEVELEELVHGPRDGRRRRLVQHPGGQTLQMQTVLRWVTPDFPISPAEA